MTVSGEGDPSIGVPEPSRNLSGGENPVVQPPTSGEVPEVVGTVEGDAVVQVDGSESVSEAVGTWQSEYETPVIRTLWRELWRIH